MERKKFTKADLMAAIRELDSLPKLDLRKEFEEAKNSAAKRSGLERWLRSDDIWPVPIPENIHFQCKTSDSGKAR